MQRGVENVSLGSGKAERDRSPFKPGTAPGIQDQRQRTDEGEKDKRNDGSCSYCFESAYPWKRLRQNPE